MDALSPEAGTKNVGNSSQPPPGTVAWDPAGRRLATDSVMALALALFRLRTVFWSLRRLSGVVGLLVLPLADKRRIAARPALAAAVSAAMMAGAAAAFVLLVLPAADRMTVPALVGVALLFFLAAVMPHAALTLPAVLLASGVCLVLVLVGYPLAVAFDRFHCSAGRLRAPVFLTLVRSPRFPANSRRNRELLFGGFLVAALFVLAGAGAALEFGDTPTGFVVVCVLFYAYAFNFSLLMREVEIVTLAAGEAGGGAVIGDVVFVAGPVRRARGLLAPVEARRANYAMRRYALTPLLPVFATFGLFASLSNPRPKMSARPQDRAFYHFVLWAAAAFTNALAVLLVSALEFGVLDSTGGVFVTVGATAAVVWAASLLYVFDDLSWFEDADARDGIPPSSSELAPV